MCQSKRQTVLVVEDEHLIRMLLVDSLSEAGFDVLEAETADDALPMLLHSDSVELLLTDVKMPGSMDGVALATDLVPIDPQKIGHYYEMAREFVRRVRYRFEPHRDTKPDEECFVM